MFPSRNAVFPSKTAGFPTTTAVFPSTAAVFPSTTALFPSTTAVFPSTTSAYPSTTAVFPSTTAVFPSTAAVFHSTAASVTSPAVINSRGRPSGPTLHDSPPPPYRERPSPHDRLHPRSDEDDLTSSKFSQSSRYESQETGGRVPTSGWCSVRYWEKSTRVGAAFEVASDSVSVVGSSASLTVHSGLCLNLLSASLSNTSQEALKIKNKIGPGILICREDSEVWLYNQSNVDVFVSSPALPESIEDTSRFDSPSVRKIKPGHTLKIFSFDLVDSLSRISAKRSRLCGRVDVFCVNVSFCKGFGSSYKRREITACPCWLQLHLEPPR
ncbi:mothers against decapentaplegic homolog 6 isoform X2 [Hyalella azteca]|uniref:Mothers against decapentaplegic homolog 6 isoform X2 n=1 Tax=Hyalella azteca TaxID=294128 RepID=A0A8B7NYT6_HYAAZ|nr:mothers against decapentaplegic homolog 6 isoform X2 [Hyalella azteca]